VIGTALGQITITTGLICNPIGRIMEHFSLHFRHFTLILRQHLMCQFIMQQKLFWQRPEGITGLIFLIALVAGGVALADKILPFLVNLAQNSLYLAGLLGVLGAVVYMVLDPKLRNLIWYIYKSVMRSITGVFVQIDPIGILKSYIEDLEDTLRSMSKQIGALRGQMRQLKGTMDANAADIQKNLAVAERAKKQNDDKNVALNARKAGRLQEANAKYDVLYKRMEVLYRILTKMYENSEIMLEDTKDQVQLKEQEYQAIKASHSAIKSAMSIISGDPDQRAMFDMALESLADDVSNKVGEMERFMDTSKNLMASIDLQNGVFEDEGLQLLEKWEQESPLLGNTTPKSMEKPLDLNSPPKQILKEDNDYTRMFD
jgi:phage shock protein A